ncbi:MAG: hypothetical protein ABIQ74_08230 [Chitinophagales bacterium]
MIKIILIIFAIGCITTSGYGYSIKQLTATYQSGQIFLNWKVPTATNLQYNIYRSKTPILTSLQLTNNNYLGYVRDNSAKNLRKSELQNDDFYFVIKNNNPPLASDRGLYVATCTSSSLYYYAVTVTNLENNKEDKGIISESNSLLLPVLESVAAPQAVLQAITEQSNGDISYEYVIWGNNQDAVHWHAFNNVGSFGYNFTLQKRGNYNDQPLCIQFQDQNPFKKLDSDFCSDCNMLQLDDWLPNGQNSYWIGYHEGYNMYLSNGSNPVATTGVIKTYTQVCTQAIIRWVKHQQGIDSSRVYMTGNSHNGFGAILTAMNIPAEISSFYVTSPPYIYKPAAGDKREHQLGSVSCKLPTDINYPGTSDPIVIWDFTDFRNWYRINQPNGIPYGQGINGKNDTKAGWAQKFHYYDTVNAYQQGGTWFWDQRVHNGKDAQFTSSETKTDYTRFYTNRSFPAFSNCTINQDPGTGDPNEGDAYGAINGYLDWDDNSIVDKKCSYTINCFIKTLYVDGQEDQNQYSSCKSDITLRRTQKFDPSTSQTITWTNYDVDNQLLQSGSFVRGDDPITLKGIKIKKAGSTIKLTASNCGNKAEALPESSEIISILKTQDGYSLVLNVTDAQRAAIDVYDQLGRTVLHEELDLPAGFTSFPIKLPGSVYLIRVSSKEIHFSCKLLF